MTPLPFPSLFWVILNNVERKLRLCARRTEGKLSLGLNVTNCSPHFLAQSREQQCRGKFTFCTPRLELARGTTPGYQGRFLGQFSSSCLPPPPTGPLRVEDVSLDVRPACRRVWPRVLWVGPSSAAASRPSSRSGRSCWNKSPLESSPESGNQTAQPRKASPFKMCSQFLNYKYYWVK